MAICVATYLRPEGLTRLLRALASAYLPISAPTTVDVVVVDNDPEGSARATCESAREWLPFDLHYAIEKRRGIPQARNTALAVAIPFADFIAFTDDDVEPSPGWLAELLKVQQLYQADVVAGPCPPRFQGDPPDWLLKGRFLDPPQRPTGTLVDTAATHNVLVRGAVFRGMDRLFDERFALHGGTDTEFFWRVRRAGHPIVWAEQALAYECVPASRMTLRWLIQRRYRIANRRGSREWRRLQGLNGIQVFASGLNCLARGSALLALAVALRRGASARVQAVLQLAAGAGWLTGLLGLGYREYA